MNLFRIARHKYAHDLSGEGGLRSVARWHSHKPVIYTSPNSSTCILEKMVHLHPGEIHNDLVIIRMELPDAVEQERIAVSQLPKGWDIYPAPPLLQMIGNEWIAGCDTLLLFVPSVIDPLAENVLLNPLHPQIKELRIADIHPFRFDERLFPLR